MVLTAYSGLSLVTGLYCHHRRCDAKATSLAWCAAIITSLTPASGRQDHTASPSASSALRLCAPPRPPHPAPNVR